MIIDNLLKDNINGNKRNVKKEPKILRKGGQIMNKNMFKKIICFVIALMMVMPNLPVNIVMAEAGNGNIEWPNPGAINLIKEETKVADGRWKIDLKVEGKNVQKTSDIVLVIDRSGSMEDDDKMLSTKNAAKSFINTLLNDSNKAYNRIALISYSSDYERYGQSSEVITVHSNFVNSEEIGRASCRERG